MSTASNLPFEVLDQIFKYCCSKSTTPHASVSWLPTNSSELLASALVCRNWRLPAQGRLFRRVLLPFERISTFYIVIANNEYLRESVKAVYLLDQILRGNWGSPSSIVKLLGPTVLHLTLPKTLNLQDLPYSSYARLVDLEAYFYSPKPPCSPKSWPDYYGDDEYEDDSHGEDLDHEIYDEDYVLKLDSEFIPLLPGSIRLTTLILTTKRPSSEFLDIISSVGPTLINLSLYFQHPINYKKGLIAFPTTFNTLRRFRYHYNSPLESPSRLLESILPQFKKLQVLSIYSENILPNFIDIIPKTLIHLEINDSHDLRLPDLIKPLRIPGRSPKLSLLRKLVIIKKANEYDLWDLKPEINVLKKWKITFQFAPQAETNRELFQLCKYPLNLASSLS